MNFLKTMCLCMSTTGRVLDTSKVLNKWQMNGIEAWSKGYGDGWGVQEWEEGAPDRDPALPVPPSGICSKAFKLLGLEIPHLWDEVSNTAQFYTNSLEDQIRRWWTKSFCKELHKWKVVTAMRITWLFSPARLQRSNPLSNLKYSWLRREVRGS